MIEAKLKACPFCGEKITDHGFQGAPWDRGYYIKCESCGARGPTTDHEDEAVANVRWNERAGEREPETAQNSEAKGQFAPCPGSVAASEQSIWLEYKHATPPQAIVKGYEAEENECVAELLNGIPNDGGSATKANFENLVRMAFQGGLAAAITRNQ